MKKNKKAGSLIGIIIGVFILSIILIGIINILGFSKNTLNIYNDTVTKYILESNISNINKKIDNSIINENTNFYIYKDTINKKFKYFTGTTNKQYQYIDKLGNKVDPNTNIGKTFKLELYKTINILTGANLNIKYHRINTSIKKVY